MLTWCRLYITLFLFMNFDISYSLSDQNSKTISKLSKVPISSDLNTFLNVIKKVTKYFHNNFNIIDLNVYFGLFLANVNLKHALEDKRRRITFASKLYEIIDLNTLIMKHFYNAIENENTKLNREEKMILNLFSNETNWINHLNNFTKVTLKGRTTKEVLYIFNNLKKYLAEIQSFESGVPNPAKSDKCLASLAQSYNLYNNKCPIDDSCRDVLKNGTNFGYSLTHRLLMFLTARYSRGCTIFTNSEDRYITKRFCSMLYVEAEFIAIQDFEDGLVDLMLEIICLCGLHGHVQFLDRNWLDQIIRFQTSYGCFAVDLKKVAHTSSQRALKRKLYGVRVYDTLKGLCNGHTTTLALATYTIAVRYILESY